MHAEELRTVFSRWKTHDLSAAGIEFRESYDPPFDPNDDYRVIYEAFFEPTALDKARIEFWITDKGHVSVGIETYERIVRRLNLKAVRHGFAIGHEPRIASKEGLQALFSVVTLGNLYIEVGRALRMITSTRLYISASVFDQIERSGYRCSDWLTPIPDRNVGNVEKISTSLGEVVGYRPWQL